jgi:hypothetical protein
MPATIAQVAITIETRILLRSSQAADQGHSHGRQKEQEWKLAGQGRDFLLLSYRAKDSGSRNHLQHADHKAFVREHRLALFLMSLEPFFLGSFLSR